MTISTFLAQQLDFRPFWTVCFVLQVWLISNFIRVLFISSLLIDFCMFIILHSCSIHLFLLHATDLISVCYHNRLPDSGSVFGQEQFRNSFSFGEKIPSEIESPQPSISSPPLLSKTPVSPTLSIRAKGFSDNFAVQQSPLASPHATPFTSMIQGQQSCRRSPRFSSPTDSDKVLAASAGQRRSPRFSSPPALSTSALPENAPIVAKRKSPEPDVSYLNFGLPNQHHRVDNSAPLAVLVLPSNRPALKTLSPPQYNTRSSVNSAESIPAGPYVLKEAISKYIHLYNFIYYPNFEKKNVSHWITLCAKYVVV